MITSLNLSTYAKEFLDSLKTMNSTRPNIDAKPIITYNISYIPG